MLEEVQWNRQKNKGIVLIADVNNLKCINDTFGQPRGDDAIISVAAAIAYAAVENGDIENSYRQADLQMNQVKTNMKSGTSPFK